MVSTDELDLQLIGHLREDGRKSNRELARELGYSEATVRRRVRVLIDEGHIKIVAIADPYRLGFTIDVIMGVQVAPGTVTEAARGFAAVENVRAVTITTGAADLIIAALFRSNDEMLQFMSKGLAEIPGVVQITTSQAIKVVKRSFDLFPESVI
jgi:Lrp/AsnC family transcriptional regulator, regulator for asnA, asnC and gidA